MSAEQLVKNCAPTLAGIKTGSLYNLGNDTWQDAYPDIRELNRLLSRKGLRIIPVKTMKGNILIYVFRPENLKKDLNCPIAREMLNERGYDTTNTDCCVAKLADRLRKGESFPHEIGFFLGYPANDVRCFIENPNKNLKCVGCWKVYSNERRAKRLFEKYRLCTRELEKRYKNGSSLEQLVVSNCK